ncbi:MAG: metallophosphoesterase [Oscillospiraceae bacterium]|jgi:hypothetical protein|nr:metallophosphoesterase [Oscillospiraceae bacterium]
MGRTFITGDCHGDYKKFAVKSFPVQRDLTKEDVIIQLGDFGLIWDYRGENRQEEYWKKWFEKRPFTTLFIDGENENHERLGLLEETEMFGGKVGKVNDSVYYLKRGEVYTINGKKFFVFGGGISSDTISGLLDSGDLKFRKTVNKMFLKRKIWFRVKGETWWKEEQPSPSEMDNGLENLNKNDNTVDYILTHSAPKIGQTTIDVPSDELEDNRVTQYFDRLYNDVKFDTWFCGHFHIDKAGGRQFRPVYDNICELDKILF